MPGKSRQLPGHLTGAPGNAPSVCDSPFLDEDRDIVPVCDLVRVAPGVFRNGSDVFYFLERLLWLQKLVRRQPAVRFAPDEVEHPITEHTEPDRDRVAGLGFDRGFLGSKVLSWIGEVGGSPETSEEVNSLFERLHLFPGGATDVLLMLLLTFLKRAAGLHQG